MKENEEPTDMQDDQLISCLLGEASPEEMAQVETWRHNDAVFNQRYLQFKALWDTSKGLNDDQEPDPQAAFQRYKKKANQRRDRRQRVILKKKASVWMAIAASFLLVAGGGWLYFGLLRVEKINIATQAQTGAAILPDGSVVTLNHFSRFVYPTRFARASREVQLNSGEAFFKIMHNKEKPFLITAGGTLIRVVGTAFNVKNTHGIVEVIVETGIVQVSSNSHALLLHAGDKLTISQTKDLCKKERNPDQLYTYYRTKKFVAEDTPLWRMVEVLNEAYGCHIVISRKELNNLPLNTTFENESLDKVLDVISRTFKIIIEKKRGTILLK